VFGKASYQDRRLELETWRGGFAVSDGNQSNWCCLISSDRGGC